MSETHGPFDTGASGLPPSIELAPVATVNGQQVPLGSAASNPLYTTLTPPQAGTAPLPTVETSNPASAAAMPAGGTGVMGWLSGLFAAQGANPSSTAPPAAAGTGVLGWLAGAYTQLGSIVTTLAGTLKVADGNNASYSFWPTIAASSGGSGNPPAGTYTPPAGTRAIGVSCTAAATIQMTDGTGNVQPWQIAVGSSILPFMPASFTLSSGTATFFGDR